jgi:hypothetical protein
MSIPPAVSSGLELEKCWDTNPQIIICIVGQYAISIILGHELLNK